MTQTLPKEANQLSHSTTEVNTVMPTDEQSIAPAVLVGLTGEHLIEASAGTGKTWTLTGILLRLLIEAKRAPEQIIATTFTRAAAAEMRQRVNERLIDFYQVLQWLNTLQDNLDYNENLYPEALQVLPEMIEPNNKNNATNNATKPLSKNNNKASKISPNERASFKSEREEWLKQQAKLAGMSERVDDPINLHLVGYLLDNVSTYPLADALRRTELVLTTLDKLFVGTLDSLAQKWLAEYSAETGYRKGMGITEDIKVVTDGIIHDELRQFQSQLYYNQPKIYQLLQDKGDITGVDDHRKAVEKALTFISAPIDEVDIDGSFAFNELEALLAVFKSLDLKDIAPYFDKDYRKSQGIRGKSNLDTKIMHIEDIQKAVHQYGYNFYNHLNDEAIKVYAAIKSVFPDLEGKIVGFNNNKEKFHSTFINLKTIKTLKEIHDKTDELDEYLKNIITTLNRNIVMSVRAKLPSILEERNETTFTLQMVRLNQALSGRQGHKLARYIRHHYPVALIDESQDINGEQAQMIERIYLPSNQARNPTHKQLLDGALGANDQSANSDAEKKINTFLLLVGDPKQAIYGFRGGDVANYNHMKAKFKDPMTLNLNRRSNAQLIDALNHWFGCPIPLIIENTNNPTFELSVRNENSLSNINFNVLSELGENIHYQYIKAHNQQAKLSWQMTASHSANTNVNLDSNPLEVKANTTASSIDELLPNKPVAIIHLPKDDNDYDESEATAYHIAALLESQQTIEGRPIRPSDIGVLGRRKLELKRIEDLLIKLEVPTLSTSEVSIFETMMAADLVALMEAMLRSYRRDTINRALTSQFFGLSLRQVKAMMVSHDNNSGADNDLTVGSGLADEDKNAQRYQDFITHIKEAAERWQNRGILPALHHLLGKSPIHPKGAWQSLAALADGERHIMDLRHLLDILAQYSMNMGEHELLSWYKQNMTTISTGDWAKQQPLPTESGVQLMTIHKSKGLEFPIVYVVGMDGASNESGFREKHGLYLYNAHDLSLSSNIKSTETEQVTGWQRQLSPVKGTSNDSSCFTQVESDENYSERKRLGYVAFTRASEQLYIVLKDPKDKKGFDRKPALKWLETTEPKFVLPERLQSKVGWIAGHKIFEFNEQKDSKSKQSLTVNTSSSEIKSVTPINYPNLDQLMPSKFFYGWAKTSFTALARQLTDQSQDLAIMDERSDDDLYIATNRQWDNTTNIAQISVKSISIDNSHITALKPVDDIRFSFVKGANAGTFLHEVFEKIDFVNQSLWSTVIDKAIRDYQLPSRYTSAEQQLRVMTYKEPLANNLADSTSHQALLGWIDEVIKTPLSASNQTLESIPTHKRFAELSFNMGLSENFRVEGLNDVFRHHLPDEPDKHVMLTKHNIPHLYRYLRGEIDLVYEHAGKYFVVDYKSNYLGNSLSDYNEQTLSEAMSKAGYWLQAAIYQVALHRFLSIRIKDYVGNEEQYLGAVEYVFLRGTLASSMEDKLVEDNFDNSLALSLQQRFGLVKWDMPINFIKALDAAFGKPSR